MAEKDLGYRRVQSTGRGSYIISLPKEWIQDIGLKKGSEIDFNVQADSSLTLVPRKLKEKYEEDEDAKLKEYYINVDEVFFEFSILIFFVLFFQFSRNQS